MTQWPTPPVLQLAGHACQKLWRHRVQCRTTNCGSMADSSSVLRLSGHDYDWDVEQLASEVTAWRHSVLKEVRANVRTGASCFVCSA